MIDRMDREALGARAARAFVVAFLSIAAAAPARADFCSNCILNQTAPQVAVMNIGTATIRGTLEVSTVTAINLSVTNLTVTTLTGNGAAITALNATQLLTGTVPSGRMTGSYTGITGVGTVTAGTWRATIVQTQYGGTGQNWAGVAAGAIPYFSSVGTMTTVASPSGQRVLFTAGSGAAPVWVSSPTLTGQNFSAIPLTALANGTLQAGVQVPNASLVSIDAAKVSGNIAGGAATLTIPLPIGNLAAGTLPTTNAASSITVTGVTPGVFGGPSNLAQINVRADGRIASIAQFNIVIPSTGIAPGPLPVGVTIAAAQITSGTLAGNVIASSVAATGVAVGTIGGVAKALTLTVMVDGRLSAATQANIALPPAQITAGTLPGDVLVPAANIQAGALGASVRASSVAASGVTPGVYGGSGAIPALTVATDGRVTSATQYAVPSLSTSVALVNVDNNWAHSQTSQSSWTIKDNLGATGSITGAFINGNGAGLTAITAANISAGSLGASVIASSIAVNAVLNASIVTVSGSKVTGNITGTSSGAAPTGAAGGNLSGTYPNPSVASLPAISGANLTALTAANISAGSLGAGVIASSIAVNAVLDASVVTVSGSKITGNITGSATPSGAAGGNLTGTYPNPTVASLPAISGANLTSLTGANVTGNITGSAGLNVLKTGDTMTGRLNGTDVTMTYGINAATVAINSVNPTALLEIQTTALPVTMFRVAATTMAFTIYQSSVIPSIEALGGAQPVLFTVRRSSGGAPGSSWVGTAGNTGLGGYTWSFANGNSTNTFSMGILGTSSGTATGQNNAARMEFAVTGIDTVSRNVRMVLSSEGWLGIGAGQGGVIPGTKFHMSTGTLTVDGTSAIINVVGQLNWGSGVNKSTGSTTGALTLASGAALNTSGAAGYVISQSSVSGASYSIGSSLGISSTCTSGQYVSGQTITGGITLGGSCAAAGTGDASLSATQTFTGSSNTFTNNVAVGSNVIVGVQPVGYAPVNSQLVTVFNGVFVSSTPTPSCANMVGGTTCAFDSAASNDGGIITLAGSGTGFDIVFSRPWKKIKFCQGQLYNNVAVGISAISNTSVTFTWSGGANGIFTYSCGGAP